MSRFKIINLFDKLFISISIFLLLYAWINFFIRNLWTTFILSLIFTFAVTFILFYFINSFNQKKTINKKYLLDIEEKFLAFKLLRELDKLNLIKSIIEKELETKKIKNTICYLKDNKYYQIIIATDKENLTQFDIENLISHSQKNIDVLKIICCNFNTNINTKILKNLEIEIITKKKLYDEFFLRFNVFPDCSNLNTKTERKKFKEVVKNFFVPHKAKSYFFCGLILIFSSIILPYHYYYLIFVSTLMLFSILCKLQPLFKH